MGDQMSSGSSSSTHDHEVFFIIISTTNTITTDPHSSKLSSIMKPIKEEEEESFTAATGKTGSSNTTTNPPSLPPPCKQQQQVPWLMLSKVDRHEKSRSFFSLDEKQVHKIKLSNAANRSWCSGSSDGWLVMSHKTQGNFLYNPITQHRINLPSHEIISYIEQQEGEEYLDQRLRDLYRHGQIYFMDKAIIVSSSSSSSLSDNFIVAAIYERTSRHGFSVGFCRPGDKEWCNVSFNDNGDHDDDDANGEEEDEEEDEEEHEHEEEEEEDEEKDEHEHEEEEEEDEEEDEHEEEEEEEADHDDELFAADIIFYKGGFYVVTRTRKLGIIDICSGTNDNHPSSGDKLLNGAVRWLDIQPLRLKKSEKFTLNNYYLVESCGELLMVIRLRKENNRQAGPGQLKTKKFSVFKLDETGDDTPKWVRVKSLGDQILFLGSNYSKSVSASDILGFRGNCIYFTDDYRLLFMCSFMAPVCYRDIGVFYLEDGKIEPIFPTDDNLTYYRKYCSSRKYPPTFITPNPSPYMVQ